MRYLLSDVTSIMVHCDGDIAARHGATLQSESVTRGTVVREQFRSALS